MELVGYIIFDIMVIIFMACANPFTVIKYI